MGRQFERFRRLANQNPVILDRLPVATKAKSPPRLDSRSNGPTIHISDDRCAFSTSHRVLRRGDSRRFKEPNKKVEVSSEPFKLLRDVNIQ